MVYFEVANRPTLNEKVEVRRKQPKVHPKSALPSHAVLTDAVMAPVIR